MGRQAYAIAAVEAANFNEQLVLVRLRAAFRRASVMLVNVYVILLFISWAASPALVVAYWRMFKAVGASPRWALLTLAPGVGFFLASGALAFACRRRSRRSPDPSPVPLRAEAF